MNILTCCASSPLFSCRQSSTNRWPPCARNLRQCKPSANKEQLHLEQLHKEQLVYSRLLLLKLQQLFSRTFCR